MRFAFPVAALALVLFALPGVGVFIADLLGYGPDLNAALERSLGLSHRLALSIPAALALFAVPLVIIVLHMLKLRRKPVVVSSTLLWRASAEDLHANALLRWLRRNVPLLLQLLAAFLFTYAVLGPRLHAATGTGRRYILVIDNSASMAATDAAPTRLEWAKAAALKEIDAATDDDTGMVIVFNRTAEIRQSYTSDRDLLRVAVRGIEQSSAQTRLDEALRLAAGLANPARSTENEAARPANVEPGKERTYVATEGVPAEVHLYSDGGFPAVPDFALANLTLNYHPPPTSGTTDGTSNNLAITRLDATPADAGTLAVTATLRNYRIRRGFARGPAGGAGGRPRRARLRPTREARPAGLGRHRVHDSRIERFPAADAGRDGGFPLARRHGVGGAGGRPQGAGRGRRWTEPRARRLPRFPRNEEARRGHPPHARRPDERREVSRPGPGRGFRSRRLRSVCPGFCRGHAAGEHPIPGLAAAGGWGRPEASGEPAGGGLGRLAPGHAGLAGALRCANRRGDAAHGLAATHGTPHRIRWQRRAARRGARPPFADLVLAFPIIDDAGKWNTLWPLEPSFILFLRNVLRAYGGAAGFSEEPLRPGDTVPLRTGGAKRVTIATPTRTETLDPGDRGEAVFGGTAELGLYTATIRDERLQFAVNLFDPDECDLSPRASVTVGSQTAEAGEVRRPPRELWKWAVGAALLVLLGEWWVYASRVR